MNEVMNKQLSKHINFKVEVEKWPRKCSFMAISFSNTSEYLPFMAGKKQDLFYMSL